MAHFQDVVGIDVSKETLDVFVLSHQQQRAVANAAAGHCDLVNWLKSLGVRIAVMEASGGYERTIAGCGGQALTWALSIPGGFVISPKRPVGWPRTTKSMPA